MKIIGESTHEWPQTSLLTAAHILFYFLHDFRVLNIDKSMKTPINRSPLHWSGIVTSRKHLLWRILVDCHENVSKCVTCVSRRRQVDYHSLIIENYSRRFHWLACKKWNIPEDCYFLTRNSFNGTLKGLADNDLFYAIFNDKIIEHYHNITS